MNRSALIAASAAAAMLFASAARAETREIRTSDLDLTTDAGQVALDNRIERAARAVCKMDRTGTRLTNGDAECRAKAEASARAALASRGVAIRYSDKSGG